MANERGSWAYISNGQTQRIKRQVFDERPTIYKDKISKGEEKQLVNILAANQLRAMKAKYESMAIVALGINPEVSDKKQKKKERELRANYIEYVLEQLLVNRCWSESEFEHHFGPRKYLRPERFNAFLKSLFALEGDLQATLDLSQRSHFFVDQSDSIHLTDTGRAFYENRQVSTEN